MMNYFEPWSVLKHPNRANYSVFTENFSVYKENYYGKLQICWQQWPWLSVWQQQQSLVSLFRPKWGWTIFLNNIRFTWTISRCLDKVNSLLDVDMDKAPTLTELGHFYSQFGNWLFLLLRELKIWLMKITIMAKWHNLPDILQGKCPRTRN